MENKIKASALNIIDWVVNANHSADEDFVTNTITALLKEQKDELMKKALQSVKQCSALRDSFSDDEEMVEYFKQIMKP